MNNTKNEQTLGDYRRDYYQYEINVAKSLNKFSKGFLTAAIGGAAAIYGIWEKDAGADFSFEDTVQRQHAICLTSSLSRDLSDIVVHEGTEYVVRVNEEIIQQCATAKAEEIQARASWPVYSMGLLASSGTTAAIIAGLSFDLRRRVRKTGQDLGLS